MLNLRRKAPIAVLCTYVLLLSCKSALPKDQNVDQARSVAVAKLGSEVETYPNSTGTYILIIQKPNPASAGTNLKFIVVQIVDNKVVVEQNFFPGYARWITDSSIEVLSVPGTIKENANLSDYKRIIDLPQSKN